MVHLVNNGDPLFMVGAVAVGMFHRADLGIIIAGTHYLSSIIVGLMMRFYHSNEIENISSSRKRRNNIFFYAFQELIEARKNDGRTFGELLGDSVRESVNTLLMIGGFIILFSVITKIFIIMGLINILSEILIYILEPLGIAKTMILPLISGIFEITNGANLASQAQSPLLQQVVITNAIIAWSGLSVHAQVATMINGTDIKLKPYIWARIIQSILAGIITVILFIPYQKNIEPTFLPFIKQLNLQNGFILISLIFLTILSISLIISLIIYFIRKIQIIYIKRT